MKWDIRRIRASLEEKLNVILEKRERGRKHGQTPFVVLVHGCSASEFSEEENM